MKPTTFLISIGVFALASALRAELLDDAWSLHAQSTIIEQTRGGIHSPYEGTNSLSAQAEDKHTGTLTIFIGHTLWSGAQIFYNPEVSQGNGLSSTVGVAGFPNGEATRAGAKVPEYNTARLFVRQTFGLGGDREQLASGPNQFESSVDIERLTLTAGKLSAADIFDNNAYSHDPRTQFLNWALMDNGAWDYPADVKGYTSGFAMEWNRPKNAFRYGAFMEPVGANQRALDAHLSRALAQVFEWELRYAAGEHKGAVRTLVYWNRAHMGSYANAVQMVGVPDVMLTRSYRSKVGSGLSWDQEVASGIGAFSRAGFNDGRTETWAFTEIDRTASVGLSVSGSRWGRASDTLGIAALINGLSGDHRRYLASGGYGFIVGDGRLNYSPEKILESYYAFAASAWLSMSADAQFIANPAYNRDRGPAAVFAARLHASL